MGILKHFKIVNAVRILEIIIIWYYFSSMYKVDKKIENLQTTVGIGIALTKNCSICECKIPEQHEKKKQTGVQKPGREIASNGYWTGKNSTQEHYFDGGLAKKLLTFFKSENVSSLLDLGAGMGNYSALFMSHGIFTSCYDGNPNTVEISEGRCGTVDLSKKINFMKHDWVLSLEVGEHVPAEFEDIFIQNLDRMNRKGMLLSWAVVGQIGHGHVNTHNNEYLKEKVMKMGYSNDIDTERILRDSATRSWFKETIMVFRRLKHEIRKNKNVLKLKRANKRI